MLPKDNIEYTTDKIKSKEQFSPLLVCATECRWRSSRCMYIIGLGYKGHSTPETTLPSRLLHMMKLKKT